jgi:hypothetical protein
MTEEKVTGNSLLFSHLKVVWVCVVDIPLKKMKEYNLKRTNDDDS